MYTASGSYDGYVRFSSIQRDSTGSILGTTILVVLVAIVAAGAAVYFVTPARHTSHPKTTPTKTTFSKTYSTPTTTSTTTTSTTPNTTGTGHTTSGSVVSCTASQLALSHTVPNIAAGTAGEGMSLKNVSSTACTLDGYPDIQLYNKYGQPMQTTVVRNGGYGFTSQVPTVVTLDPGSSAAFNIGFSAIPNGATGGCPSSSQVSIALPQGTFHYPAYLTVADSIAPCNGGQVTVSAIYSGSPRL